MIEVENILIRRLNTIKENNKAEKEKVADYDKRKLAEYKQWSKQVEVYLLKALDCKELIEQLDNSYD